MTRSLFILLFFALVSCRHGNPTGRESKPNLIFILIDDLGKEWISCYGAEDIETPQIDKMAREGILFDQVYSMPQCTPSRVALLTGQYPYENGWVNHYDVPRWGHQARFDPEKYPVFARELRKAGYKTCAAGKWQINDFRVEPEAMINAGFDEYCMWTGAEGGSDLEKSSKRYWDPYIHTRSGSKTYEGKFGPDIFSDFIIDFMRVNKEYPMCIYYPMVLTHPPLVATPLEPDARTKIEKHRAMVRYTDYIVGKLLSALEETGLSDNTFLFLTADNGTAQSIIGKRNGMYIRGGKATLSECGIDAPFIVKVPGTTDPGKVSDALIDFTDIFPTLLDLAGIEYGKFPINGLSFASILTGEAEETGREWIMAMGSHPATIDENDRIKNYHRFRDRVFKDPDYKIYVDTCHSINRIYCLKDDPYERNNLLMKENNVTDILKKYKNVLDGMPSEDHAPKYSKPGNSFYDIPVENLYRSSARAHALPNRMLPETEKNFLEQLEDQ